MASPIITRRIVTDVETFLLHEGEKDVKESKIEEKLKRTEARLNRAAEEKKALKARMKQLEEQAENERLVNRGRLLECYLKEPQLLSDDDAKSVLEYAFSLPAVQWKLSDRIKGKNPDSPNVLPEPKTSDLWDEIHEQ